MLREFRTLLPNFRKYYRRYLAGLLFLVMTDASQLYLPQLTRKAIDTVSRGTFALSEVLLIASEMIAVAFLIALGRYFWRSFIHGTSRRIELELRDKLFGHLQTLSSTFYGRRKTGDLMAHLTNDINAIRHATSMGLAVLLDGLLMVVAILAIMISHNARLTLMSVAPLILLSFVVPFFGRIMGEQSRRVQEGFSSLSDMAQESFSGVRVLKTFVQENAFVSRFVKLNEEYSRRNLTMVRTWGFFFPAVSFFAGVTTVIFLLFGGRSVMEGTLSPGEFTAFFAYLQMLIWPMLGAGFTINTIQRAGASMGRINRILEEVPDIQSPLEKDPRRRPIEGSIEFRQLSFVYPGSEKKILEGIDLEVPAGSILGILGRTGSGKSTLLQLLPRILDPPPETVFVDGRDVRSYDLSVLRSAISVVPQDGFLFSASIENNVAFAAAEGSSSRQTKAIDISALRRDLANFPSGIKTMVGERGITLSGGQKQRVAIARALSTDASIYILDDSLSSVDTETEDAILSAILPFLAGKTLILVSHRVSTLKTADTIVVLQDGRIAQKGSHEELLAQAGFYADIYRLQQMQDAVRGTA